MVHTYHKVLTITVSSSYSVPDKVLFEDSYMPCAYLRRIVGSNNFIHVDSNNVDKAWEEISKLKLTVKDGGRFHLTLVWTKQNRVKMILSELSSEEFIKKSGIVTTPAYNEVVAIRNAEVAVSQDWGIGHVATTLGVLISGGQEEAAQPIAACLEDLIDAGVDKVGKRYTRLFAPHERWSFKPFTCLNRNTVKDDPSCDGHHFVDYDFVRKATGDKSITEGMGLNVTVLHPKAGFMKGLAVVRKGLPYDVIGFEAKADISSDGVSFFGIVGKLHLRNAKTDWQSVVNFYTKNDKGAELMKYMGNSHLDGIEKSLKDKSGKTALANMNIDVVNDVDGEYSQNMGNTTFLMSWLKAGIMSPMSSRSIRGKFLNLMAKRNSDMATGRIKSDMLFRFYLSPVAKSFEIDGADSGYDLPAGTVNLRKSGILEIPRKDAKKIMGLLGGCDFDTDSVVVASDGEYAAMYRNPNGSREEHYIAKINIDECGLPAFIVNGVSYVDMFRELTKLPCNGDSEMIINDIKNGDFEYVVNMFKDAPIIIDGLPRWTSSIFEVAANKTGTKTTPLDRILGHRGGIARRIKKIDVNSRNSYKIEVPWNVKPGDTAIKIIDEYRKACVAQFSGDNMFKDAINKIRWAIMSKFMKLSDTDGRQLMMEMSSLIANGVRNSDAVLFIEPNAKEIALGYSVDKSPAHILLGLMIDFIGVNPTPDKPKSIKDTDELLRKAHHIIITERSDKGITDLGFVRDESIIFKRDGFVRWTKVHKGSTYMIATQSPNKSSMSAHAVRFGNIRHQDILWLFKVSPDFKWMIKSSNINGNITIDNLIKEDK